jgi:regulator of nucleoside diphosphate kinase
MTTEKTVTTARSHVKPAIILSAKDHDRLSTLAHAARSRLPDLASELAEEVGRARVLGRDEIADNFVGMNDDLAFATIRRDVSARSPSSILTKLTSHKGRFP